MARRWLSQRRYRRPRVEPVTAYLWMGEDEWGRAMYHATRLAAVVFRSGGSRQAALLRGEDKAQMYFFESELEYAGLRWAMPEAFDAMEAGERAGCFTLRADGTDRIHLGHVDGAVPPAGARTLRVLRVDIRLQGERIMRHIKAVCM